MARKKRATAKPPIIQTCHLAEYYAALYIRLSVEDTNTASVSIDSQRIATHCVVRYSADVVTMRSVGMRKRLPTSTADTLPPCRTPIMAAFKLMK